MVLRRRWRLLAISVLAGTCVITSRPCAADEAVVADSAAAASATGAAAPAWLTEISWNGFLSSSYSYNFNRPSSGTNQFRVFDFDDNTLKLDVFELVAQKAVTKPRDSGFRVDLTLGSSIPRIAASAGLFRNDSGEAEDIDVHQAFASWIAPVGSGLRVDFGKFITPFGYEVIEGYDGWNDNGTRSLLFGFAIPFTHVGARASYAFSSRASLLAMVVNGWDVARDNNRSKSVGAQLALTPVRSVSVSLNGMWGPERPGDDSDARALLDAVVILKAGDRLTLGVNGDWGTDENAIPGSFGSPSSDAEWSGVAGYARLAPRPSFAVTVRAESFDDRDGVRTGVAQTLREFTLTPELRLTPHLLVRGDARVDRSNHPVFEKTNGSSRSQPSVLFDVIYSF